MQYEDPTGLGTAAYVDADAALGVEGSRVRAAAIESHLRELDHLIAYSGQTPARGDLQQVRKAIQALISGATRPKLIALRDYFVSPAGNDANNGLSGGAPFLTIQAALEATVALDLGGQTSRINLADGTYTAAVIFQKPFVGSGEVLIQGNVASPQNVVLDVTGQTAMTFGESARVRLKAFEVRATGVGVASGIRAAGRADVKIDTGMRFGACSEAQMQADGLGTIALVGAYSITGDARMHWTTLDMGRINGAIPITLVGTRAFSFAFATAFEGSVIRFDSAAGGSFVGSATGRRYEVHTNSVIWTNSAGGTFLPGNVSGAPFTGGQYK